MQSTTSSPALLEALQWRYATKQFDPTRRLDDVTLSTLEQALVLAASSGGLQPWKFIIVSDPEIKAQLVPVMFGQPQARDASQVVVFAAHAQYSAQEVDRYIAHTAAVRNVPVGELEAFRQMLLGGIVEAKNEAARFDWAARQTCIALGTVLTSAALLGVDACPMEGFDAAGVDDLLGLREQGLRSTVICSIGYRSAEDPYAALPKVRFPAEEVIQHL